MSVVCEHVQFVKDDIVKVLEFEAEGDAKVIAKAKVMNVVGSLLHGSQICEGVVSIHIMKSYNDQYELYESVELDDPLIRRIGEVVGNLVLWPVEFLQHGSH